eukprot:g5088.t1
MGRLRVDSTTVQQRTRSYSSCHIESLFPYCRRKFAIALLCTSESLCRSITHDSRPPSYLHGNRGGIRVT